MCDYVFKDETLKVVRNFLCALLSIFRFITIRLVAHYLLIITCMYFKIRGNHSGLMVSALDSGWSGPGSRPGRGSALCFWARHFTFIVLSSPRCLNGYRQIYCWGNPAMD